MQGIFTYWLLKVSDRADSKEIQCCFNVVFSTCAYLFLFNTYWHYHKKFWNNVIIDIS